MTLSTEELCRRYKTFGLVHPRDWLEKLAWDVEQLGLIDPGAPEYQYQAINCAITAWSMCDWVYWADDKIRATFSRERPFRQHMQDTFEVLAVCRELADAAKHHTLSDKPSSTIGTPFVDVYEHAEGYAVRIPVQHAHQFSDAHSIMQQAHDVWTTFLRDRGLV